MKKTVTLAPLLAASLGLTACGKKGEDKAAASAALTTETQPNAPVTPPAEPSAPAPSSDTPAAPQTPTPTPEQSQQNQQ